MNRVIVGVGSNIQPHYYVKQTQKHFFQEFPTAQSSTFIETKPIGSVGQDNYLNGAFLIETDKDQPTLKQWLLKMEADLGRVRSSDKFAARTIDLDILVWNGRIVDTDVYERDFLKESIHELWPEVLTPPSFMSD